MAVRTRSFRATHFEPRHVSVRMEPLTLVDGRTLGGVVVAETADGSVARVVKDESVEDAKLRVAADALNGEVDVVPWEEILVRHSTDSHIDGGTVRAVTPYGCVTSWADPEEGATLEVARRVVRRALRGDLEGDRELESREEAMERYP